MNRTRRAGVLPRAVFGMLVLVLLAMPSGNGRAAEACQDWIEPVTRMEFVWVPRGCALIGSPDDELGRLNDEGRYEVCVEGYWLGKYEVTNV